MQTRQITISMTVQSLLVNQGDDLTLEEQQLILTEFLSSQIYFPTYATQGEINGKQYEIQMIFNKKSPQLNNLDLGIGL